MNVADESFFKIFIYTALAELDSLSVHVGLTKRGIESSSLRPIVSFSHDPNNAEDPPLAGKDAHNLKIGRNKNVENTGREALAFMRYIESSIESIYQRRDWKSLLNDSEKCAIKRLKTVKARWYNCEIMRNSKLLRYLFVEL
ncbi:hypothetical protein EAF00_010708 [Botryotinia globosa]|nr:hypothetical protein EAF00_010708 [Botryotinia globosa]